MTFREFLSIKSILFALTLTLILGWMRFSPGSTAERRPSTILLPTGWVAISENAPSTSVACNTIGIEGVRYGFPWAYVDQTNMEHDDSPVLPLWKTGPCGHGAPTFVNPPALLANFLLFLIFVIAVTFLINKLKAANFFRRRYLIFASALTLLLSPVAIFIYSDHGAGFWLPAGWVMGGEPRSGVRYPAIVGEVPICPSSGLTSTWGFPFVYYANTNLVDLGKIGYTRIGARETGRCGTYTLWNVFALLLDFVLILSIVHAIGWALGKTKARGS